MDDPYLKTVICDFGISKVKFVNLQVILNLVKPDLRFEWPTLASVSGQVRKCRMDHHSAFAKSATRRPESLINLVSACRH